MYSFEEAAKAGILKDPVVFHIQGKPFPIHQGHIDMINFGKTLGNVVVVIQSRMIEQALFFVYGGRPPKPWENQEDLSQEIASIEALGVNCIVRQPRFDINDGLRNKLLQEAKDKVKPYEKYLIIDKQINHFIYHHMAMKLFPFETPIKHLLFPAHPIAWVLKEAYKNDGYARFPGNMVICPNITRDPGTGVRVGSYRHYPLTTEEKAAMPELKKMIPSVLLKPGVNQDLINAANKSKDISGLWKVENAVQYAGGIFGADVFNFFSWRGVQSNIPIEDWEYIPGK